MPNGVSELPSGHHDRDQVRERPLDVGRGRDCGAVRMCRRMLLDTVLLQLPEGRDAPMSELQDVPRRL